MTQLSITIPDSIYNGVQALASKENMSIDQFVARRLGWQTQKTLVNVYNI
jgi:hypothetical protein